MPVVRPLTSAATSTLIESSLGIEVPSVWRIRLFLPHPQSLTIAFPTHGLPDLVR
jgi:hypothetical protein